jgi:hypothetical protein
MEIAEVGDQVHTGDGGSLVFELTDGSLLVMTENSTLTVHESLTTYDAWDLVNVMVQTVHFRIRQFGLATIPDAIGAPTAVIAVRG